jgi:signal transduction histidine kinase
MTGMAQDDISFTDFIASTIHDMKNSLNVQITELEKVAAQCHAHGDQQTYNDLGRVIYQSSRMNANLIQLLSLYKLGRSIYPIDISEHAIAEVLEDGILQSRSIMEFKGVTVSVDCDPSLYWYIDRDLVTGVLTNALNNAYQYTKDRIRVAAQVVNGCLELRIEDNGTGYPAHMLLQEGITSAKGINFLSGSTGLGFYFSTRVAQMHRNGERTGTLTTENGGALGGGCFVLRLP